MPHTRVSDFEWRLTKLHSQVSQKERKLTKILTRLNLDTIIKDLSTKPAEKKIEIIDLAPSMSKKFASKNT